MKTQIVWVCLTRIGLIPTDDNGYLMAADSKNRLQNYICELATLPKEGCADILKRHRWRIAQVKLIIGDIKYEYNEDADCMGIFNKGRGDSEDAP